MDARLSDSQVVDERAAEQPSGARAGTHVEGRPWRCVARSVGSSVRFLTGVTSLVLGLSALAAIPVVQLLSLGYLLEASARVARSGRLRDGLVGVDRAAWLGGVVAGVWLVMLPALFVRSFRDSARLIDPAGTVARGWSIALVVIAGLTVLHIGVALMRGGRFRHFLWPFGNPFWLVRRLRRGGLYRECRDRFWAEVAGWRLPQLFRLGSIGFVGSVIWLALPATLLASARQYPLLGLLGGLLLGAVATALPFLQVHYAVEGRWRALFATRMIRDRFQRSPWAFALALAMLLVASLPLYLLKIEVVPREAAWLPGLLFLLFLAPARLVVGWAYARSRRREMPRHWVFRVMGRVGVLPVAALYVLVVFFSQYTSWGGVASLYEQHAFLLPVPFLNL